MNLMHRYAHKRVLLTGGASGIGQATALRMLAEGATLHAVDRDEAGLEQLREAAEAARADDTAYPGYGTLTTSVLDITDEAAVIATVAEVAGRFGSIELLANIAGCHTFGGGDEVSLDALRSTMEVNFIGMAAMCRETIPHLGKRSAIVNVASTAALHAHPYMGAYAASKGAVLAYSITLAAELAPRKIRVVAVSPGGINTPLVQAVAESGIDFTFYDRVMPLLPFAQPEQAAAMIAFAGSDDASYVTAVELRVDGGSYA